MEMKQNNNFFIFFILYTLNFSAAIFSKEILNVEELIYKSYMEQLSDEQIKKFTSINSEWNTISYFILPIILFIKIYLITSLLDIGFFLFNIKINFQQIFNIVLKAEFIFLLPIILKIIWFRYFRPEYTFTDLQNFAPLSLMNFYSYNTIEPWYIYPLRAINLFEFIYCTIIAIFVTKTTDTPNTKSFTATICSYSVGMTIWIVVVMFLVINTN